MIERNPQLAEIDLLWEAEMFRNREEIELAEEVQEKDRERAVKRGEK